MCCEFPRVWESEVFIYSLYFAYDVWLTFLRCLPDILCGVFYRRVIMVMIMIAELCNLSNLVL